LYLEDQQADPVAHPHEPALEPLHPAPPREDEEDEEEEDKKFIHGMPDPLLRPGAG
jgi:hypothetical protein